MTNRTFLSAALWVTLTALHCLAQSSATLQGTVTDLTGAGVPGATVVIRNAETGEERSARTDATGAYIAASMSPGTYRVTVTAPGLATTTATGVVLGVGQTVLQDIALKVASTSETVESRLMRLL